MNTNHSTYASIVTGADHLQVKKVTNPFILDTQEQTKTKHLKKNYTH